GSVEAVAYLLHLCTILFFFWKDWRKLDVQLRALLLLVQILKRLQRQASRFTPFELLELHDLQCGLGPVFQKVLICVECCGHIKYDVIRSGKQPMFVKWEAINNDEYAGHIFIQISFMQVVTFMIEVQMHESYGGKQDILNLSDSVSIPYQGYNASILFSKMKSVDSSDWFMKLHEQIRTGPIICFWIWSSMQA
ncbi:hypothetical protein ACJX0J_027883, partial [Zea mays]